MERLIDPVIAASDGIRWAGLIDWLPAVAAGWMPNLAFGAIAVILLRQPGRAPGVPTTARASGG